MVQEAVMGKPPPTLREMKRENKRTARRAARDIAKQMADVEKREAEMLKSMKVSCKKGDHKVSKALSLDVVRLRRTKAKVAGARSAQISLESTINNSLNGAAVAESMQNGVASMQKMGSGMNPAHIREIGANFSKEMDRMQLTEEVMEDAMEAQMGDYSEDEDEQATALLNETLHGIAVDTHMPQAREIARAPPPAGGINLELDAPEDHLDLEERLRRLMQ